MESSKNGKKEKCFDCGGQVELMERDFQKGTKIVRCRDCYLFHLYKKDFLGGWKLMKVSKAPLSTREPEK